MADMTIKEIEKLLDFNEDLLIGERICGNSERSDHLAALAFAIRQLLNAQKWREIETAPKDGTEILTLRYLTEDGSEGGNIPVREIGLWWHAPYQLGPMWRNRGGFGMQPVSWLPLPPSPEENGDV